LNPPPRFGVTFFMNKLNGGEHYSWANVVKRWEFPEWVEEFEE
jgi:hypothetical protein